MDEHSWSVERRIKKCQVSYDNVDLIMKSRRVVARCPVSGGVYGIFADKIGVQSYIF